MKTNWQKLPGFPRTRESIVERLINQEMFLFEGEEGVPRVYKLNSGAAMIWLLCDGTRTLDEIALEIATCENLQKREVLLHVRDSVERFQSLGLLEG